MSEIENELKGEEMGEHGEKISAVTDLVRDAAQNKEVKDALFSFVDTIDENRAVKKMKEFWDNAPHAVQWAMMNVPGVGGIYAPVIKFLVQTGVFEYKGAKDEKDMEEMSQWENFKMEWGTRIAAIFIPELRPILPLVQPLLELKGATEELMVDARYRLREKRLRSREQAEITRIREGLMSGGEAAE